MKYKPNPITAKADPSYAPTSKLVIVFTVSLRPVSCMGMDDLSRALEFSWCLSLAENLTKISTNFHHEPMAYLHCMQDVIGFLQ